MTTFLFDNIAASIGNTPLVKLNRIAPKDVTILAKIEGRNPAYSVKCRIAASMIAHAEQDGSLSSSMTIIEPTSGNTGIGLAMVAAARAYNITLVMPSSMSLERRKILKALGAEVILTEAAKGMKGAIEQAISMQKAHPHKYFMPQQFENPANPSIHEQTTGPEIWQDTNGKIDAFVAGVGTGGTITGVTRYLKQQQKHKVLSVAVEPSLSPVISQTLAGQEIKPAPHKIQGLGAGFVPLNLDLSVIDEVIQIDDDTAKQIALEIMRKEGILCGISSGAAVAAALQLAGQERMKDKTIVVVLPDSGERYLSSFLFSDLFSDKELVQ